MSNRICICLICHKLNDVWINFLKQFTHYDIVIIVDDRNAVTTEYCNTNIKVIRVTEKECVDAGFINVNFLTFDRLTGWEKAVYYFANGYGNSATKNSATKNSAAVYDHIWFLEDDVFLFSEQTLLNIDKQDLYQASDLLTSPYGENLTGRRNWHWRHIHIEFPPPYYNAMVCAMRVSRALLEKIREYAQSHKTLFFLEALFPTLCKHHNLVYHTPDELKTIVYRARYSLEDVNDTHLYHPIKDLNKHVEYRKK